eukprot:CAMPEP_0174307720 /NCGR_PEP_ID=MMETSP0810-20121108/1302_1 /TAXON_ID=73025 ORGANISM="Eutreptiella gymnastica-like, Strain CCMP1594" /NCGR_SAMPLE_ID=MMETSP0810 /ASSEMBLY_ACC=CAM_ASM_000659 /LENGTH=552 /DNA_ID=CAMNT_0015414855 /DNA_START=58 /DNA_END=1716 /DNA_ORIENTATION=+
MGCGQSQAMPPGAAKSDPKYKPEKPQNENRETEESDNENKAREGMKKVDMKPNGPPPGAVIMQDMDNGKGDDVIAETLPEEAKDGAGIKRRAKSFCNTQGNQINNVADLREEEERKQNQRKKSMGGDEEEQLLEDLFLFGDFAVTKPKPKPKPKQEEGDIGTELSLVENDLEEQIVKHYLERKYFQYSDFNVNLEELILNPMGADDGPHTNDVEAYRFAFGDFNLGVTEDELKAANAANRRNRPIQNYKVYNLLGHSTRVKCICISPNERYYVSSSAKDATIVMYDLARGREILYFDGHEDTIIGAHFSNDSKHLATASRDNNLILWDTVIGKQIFVFEHERIVICCCFSRDGKTIVSGCQDKVCRIWSTKKGKELLAFKEHEGIITAVSFSPDSDNVVSASSDRTLKIWSSLSGICTASISEHTGIVMACNYSADGNNILSNDEKVINVWNVKKQVTSLSIPIDQIPVPVGPVDGTKKRTFTMSSYCPGPFGWHIVAATSDRNVHIINPNTREVLLSLFCKAAVYCLSSGSRDKLALGDAFGNIYVITFSG